MMKPDTPRIIRASVRDVACRHGEPLPTGMDSIPLRAELGRRAHRQFMELYPDAVCEKGVRGRYVSRAGDILELRGRIDLLRRVEGGVRVVEFKTVLLPDGGLGAGSFSVPRQFLEQAVIYAHLVSRDAAVAAEGGISPMCEVAVRNLRDGALAVFEYDRGDYPVSEWFEEYLSQYRTAETAARAENQRRREAGERLPWGYRSYRPGQRELVQEVKRILNDGADLLLEAPTGSGKTMALLHPALQYGLLNGVRLYYATAKGEGAGPVRDALAGLARRGGGFRAHFLTALERLCAVCDTARPPTGCIRSAVELPLDPTFPDAVAALEPGITAAAETRGIASGLGVCPALVSRELARRADVIVGDYNYVYDPRVRLPWFTEDEKGRWLLVLDEAHNLFDRVAQAYSQRLDLAGLRALKGDADRELWRCGDHPAVGGLKEALALLDEALDHLEGEFPPQGVGLVEPDVGFWRGITDRFALASAWFLTAFSGWVDDDFEEKLRRAVSEVAFFADLLERDREAHPVFGDGSARTVEAVCLNPGAAITSTHRSFTSVVGFSGTLAPLDFHRSLFGEAGRPVAVLQVESPPEPAKRAVFIAPDIDTRYRTRTAQARRIAAAIKDFASIKPGGYLAVFPSYAFIELTEQFLNGDFKLIVQHSGMTAGERVRFRREFGRGNDTRVALVTAGGLFTEAVDYPGESCVGVAVVGPCLPPADARREALRAYWDARGEDGFALAYALPAVRKVVQAAGRLIRGGTDRGGVLLMDDRYLEPPLWDILPADWRRQLTRGGDWRREVQRFWEGESS